MGASELQTNRRESPCTRYNMLDDNGKSFAMYLIHYIIYIHTYIIYIHVIVADRLTGML